LHITIQLLGTISKEFGPKYNKDNKILPYSIVGYNKYYHNKLIKNFAMFAKNKHNFNKNLNIFDVNKGRSKPKKLTQGSIQLSPSKDYKDSKDYRDTKEINEMRETKETLNTKDTKESIHSKERNPIKKTSIRENLTNSLFKSSTKNKLLIEDTKDNLTFKDRLGKNFEIVDDDKLDKIYNEARARSKTGEVNKQIILNYSLYKYKLI